MLTTCQDTGAWPRGREILFMAVMATAVLVSWSAAADSADEFIRRYIIIATEARSLWNKAQLQPSTLSEKRVRLETELLKLTERQAYLMADVDTFRTGHAQAQLDAKRLIPSRSYERLTVLGNCGALLSAWLRLVVTYFETGQPIYLQAATTTYNTWEILEKFRAEGHAP
jgi:hypothetical protein